jgi:hypothetical protein
MVVALVCRPGLRYHARRTRQRLPSLKHLLTRVVLGNGR